MKWIYKCSLAKNQDFMNMDRHKKKEKSKTILLSEETILVQVATLNGTGSILTRHLLLEEVSCSYILFFRNFAPLAEFTKLCLQSLCCFQKN